MTVTVCRYMPELTTAAGSVENGNRYTTVHRVECNDVADGPVTAVLQGKVVGPDPLPAAYSIFQHGNDTDRSVRLMSRSCSQPTPTQGGLLYFVTSEYEEPRANSAARVTETNPLAGPTKD